MPEETKEKKTRKAKEVEPKVEEVQAAELEEVTELEEAETSKETDTAEETVTDTEEIEAIETVEAAQPKAKKQEREINPDKMVAQKASRFAHEIAKANKNTRKEMYRSEHVVTEYGDEEIETDSILLRQDFLELVASAKSQKILKGKITGFRYAGETRKSTLLAEIEYSSGLFLVLIPSYLLYDHEITEHIDPAKQQIIENNIQRRIGSEVRFIVRHVDEKEQLAYADRLMAQSITGFNNYLREGRDGKPRVVNDMIVKAQVIYVVSRGVVVDALGVDITIPKDELSHYYVGDAREEFQVGDSVNVRVTNISEKSVIKNNSKYRLVTAEGSVKNAIPNHKKQLFDQFKVDGVYSADVTYVEESGVFCRLRGGIDCMCALPRYGNNPKRGQKRLVKITEKVEDNLFIYGVFSKQ